MFPREQVIHGTPQLVGEDSERFGFAVFVFEGGKIFFAGLTLPKEEDGRFGKGPAQVHVADLLARGAQAFATGFFGTFHQPTIGHKGLHAGNARDVVNLL